MSRKMNKLNNTTYTNDIGETSGTDSTMGIDTEYRVVHRIYQEASK